MTKTSINFVTVIRFIYRNFAHGGFIFFNKAGWSLHSKHPQDCQPDSDLSTVYTKIWIIIYIHKYYIDIFINNGILLRELC